MVSVSSYQDRSLAIKDEIIFANSSLQIFNTYKKYSKEFNPNHLALSLDRIARNFHYESSSLNSCKKDQIQIINKICRLVLKFVDKLEPRDLSCASYGLEQLKIENGPLYEAISKEAIRKIDQFSMLQLKDITVAFSSRNQEHPDLLAAVKKRVTDEKGAFIPQCDGYLRIVLETLPV